MLKTFLSLAKEYSEDNDASNAQMIAGSRINIKRPLPRCNNDTHADAGNRSM